MINWGKGCFSGLRALFLLVITRVIHRNCGKDLKLCKLVITTRVLVAKSTVFF